MNFSASEMKPVCGVNAEGETLSASARLARLPSEAVIRAPSPLPHFFPHQPRGQAKMASKRLTPLFSKSSNYRDFFYGSRYFLFGVLSWTPAIIFFNEHVGEIGRVNGPSMYPYLNTDFNSSLSKDITWINKWNPTQNLQRGMIIAFRCASSSLPEGVSEVYV